jgi:non-specific serine/threonine protein kinase
VPAGPALAAPERELARLVAAGLTNRDIAARTYVSERTVESRLEKLRTKLGLRSRAQLAAWAAEHLERRGDRPGRAG